MPIKMIKPPAEVLDYFFEKSRYDAATGKFYRRGKEAGWTDPNGYRLLRIKQKHLVRVHHLVWLIHTGEWPTSEIDHIDNDPSNNEFGNLRLANRNGQGANQTLQKRRVGKYKGVHQSSSGKFYVKIKVEGKQKYFGSFVTEEEAALRYNEAASFYFGNWANLNEVT